VYHRGFHISKRVAHKQPFGLHSEFLEDFIGHTIVHNQSTGGTADLAAIEEDPKHDPFDRIIHVGVLHG